MVNASRVALSTVHTYTVDVRLDTTSTDYILYPRTHVLTYSDPRKPDLN